MQKRFGVLGLMIALAGCGDYSGYYQEGRTLARLETDTTACDVTGAQDVPVSTRIQRTPVRVIPGKTTCNPAGVCTTTPTRVEGGEIYSYDANEDLRGRVVAQCMAAKGYARVTIPACSRDVSRAAEGRVQGALPPLSNDLCAARGADRRAVFVTVR